MQLGSRSAGSAWQPVSRAARQPANRQLVGQAGSQLARLPGSSCSCCSRGATSECWSRPQLLVGHHMPLWSRGNTMIRWDHQVCKYMDELSLSAHSVCVCHRLVLLPCDSCACISWRSTHWFGKDAHTVLVKHTRLFNV